MSISSDEVNFLVYRYLQESGRNRLLGRRIDRRCSPNIHTVKRSERGSDLHFNLHISCVHASLIIDGLMGTLNHLYHNPLSPSAYSCLSPSLGFLTPLRLLPFSVYVWHREPHQPVQHQWSPGAPGSAHLHHPEGPAVCGGRSQHQRGP